MPRFGRYFLPDQPLHVIQRGNNRDPIFFAEEDYAHYRDWLAAAAADYGCAVQGYVAFVTELVAANGASASAAERDRFYIRSKSLNARVLTLPSPKSMFTPPGCALEVWLLPSEKKSLLTDLRRTAAGCLRRETW